MDNKKITNYAIDPDNNTLKQFNDCVNEDFVVSASLMPDAHLGYVAPIGAVLKTKNYVVPSWVGYDIGCGIIAVKLSSDGLLGNVKKVARKLFNLINNEIPMGIGSYNTKSQLDERTKDDFKKLLEKYQNILDNEDYNYFKSQKSMNNLGTLGSGNHFIEVGEFENEIWLVIHSGSRHVGHETASKYMKIAQTIANIGGSFEKTYPLSVNDIKGQDYISSVNFCLEFALLNRLDMAYKVHMVLERELDVEIKFELFTNKNHNHVVADGDFWIHRKGATSSKLGELGVIPGNMRDGSYLVEGLGNEDFLESSSHGAGRILSRGQAKEILQMSDFRKSMNGIITNINSRVIDESPMAYKNIDDVMKAQKDSIKVLKLIKPIINCKG